MLGAPHAESVAVLIWCTSGILPYLSAPVSFKRLLGSVLPGAAPLDLGSKRDRDGTNREDNLKGLLAPTREKGDDVRGGQKPHADFENDPSNRARHKAHLVSNAA